MKLLKVLALFVVAVLLTIGCSSDRETTDEAGVLNVQAENPDPTTDPKDGFGNHEVSINPNRGYYDVIVLDIDHWELCMNYNRIRQHVTSYTGHMWYQCGSFTFEGSLTAMYNPIWDQLTVIALDSSWDYGHIMYSLKFEGPEANEFDMDGTFVYQEFPRRCNWVDAWLIQGHLGVHDAGPYVPGPVDESFEFPDHHPKKARIMAMEDEK